MNWLLKLCNKYKHRKIRKLIIVSGQILSLKVFFIANKRKNWIIIRKRSHTYTHKQNRKRVMWRNVNIGSVLYDAKWMKRKKASIDDQGEGWFNVFFLRWVPILKMEIFDYHRSLRKDFRLSKYSDHLLLDIIKNLFSLIVSEGFWEYSPNEIKVIIF